MDNKRPHLWIVHRYEHLLEEMHRERWPTRLGWSGPRSGPS
jgi:hypothetical protein